MSVSGLNLKQDTTLKLTQEIKAGTAKLHSTLNFKSVIDTCQLTR